MKPEKHRVKITREGFGPLALLGGRYWWMLEKLTTYGGGSYYSHVDSGYAFTERGAQRRAERVARRRAARKLTSAPEPYVHEFTIGEQA